MRRSWLVGTGVIATVALSGYTATAERPTAGPARSAPVVGRLYTETNARTNQVIVFDRHADGSMTREQVVPTGGAGGAIRRGCHKVDACPFVDSQGQVNLAAAQHLLFVVNAGSDTISSFRITPTGLKLADRKSAGGRFPNSLTSFGNLLYVVNTGTLNITGFRFSTSGKLTAIRGSGRTLDSRARPGTARQIGFDPTGKLLAVTILNPAEVQTFTVKANGTLSAARAFQTTDPLPFGFVFDRANRMVITQIHDFLAPHGNVASYSVTHSSGAAVPVDVKPTNGFGPCWIILGQGGRFVYVVNTGAGNPSGATNAVFKLSSAGTLKLIQITQPAQYSVAQAEFERTDELLSADGRYLYVLVHGKPPAKGRIDIFKVANGGKLTLVAETARTLPTGIGGLVGG